MPLPGIIRDEVLESVLIRVNPWLFSGSPHVAGDKHSAENRCAGLEPRCVWCSAEWTRKYRGEGGQMQVLSDVLRVVFVPFSIGEQAS